MKTVFWGGGGGHNLFSENTEENVPKELKTVRIYREQKVNTQCPNECQYSKTWILEYVVNFCS